MLLIVATSSCTAGPAALDVPSSAPLGPSLPSSGVLACQSPSPNYLSGVGDRAEIRGNAPTGSSFWALVDGDGPPLHVGKPTKLIFRLTGHGSLQIYADGPSGQKVMSDWGPEAHGGSNWSKPGDEWGTQFTFPAAGCWTVHAARSDLQASMSFDVV